MSKKYVLREFFQLCDGGKCEDLLTESEKFQIKNEGAMYLTGVMQRADVENGNGRIYPRATLEREIENYKKLIQENRAIGECVDEETEIMTRDGWKFIKDIDENEEIYVLDQKTNEIKVEKILAKVIKEHNGILLSFSNSAGTLDACYTPNHRVLITDRKNSYKEIYAEELAQKIYEKDSYISHSSLRKIGGVWSGNDKDDISFSNKKYEMKYFSAFMGIFLSEGYINKNYIQITQRKENTKNEIRKMLEDGKFEFQEKIRKNGTTDFILKDKEIINYLLPLGKSYQKYIPEDIKTLKTEYLEELLKWMLKGDGRNRSMYKRVKDTDSRIHRELCTTSLRLANDTSQIFYKLNSGCKIHKTFPKDRTIEGRQIKAIKSRPLYIVSEFSSKSISLDSRFVDIKKISYNGKVYCVKSTTGNFLMKRKEGNPFWTLNCDHPDDSVINLKNVSHMVTDVWWKGNDVIGKIKVLDTPSGNIIKSLINNGVTLGISSRSLGSVTESKGKTIVEPDLTLLCFDLVNEPSTFGAFMNLSEAKNLTSLTKSDKLFNLLKDIVGE